MPVMSFEMNFSEKKNQFKEENVFSFLFFILGIDCADTFFSHNENASFAAFFVVVVELLSLQIQMKSMMNQQYWI